MNELRNRNIAVRALSCAMLVIAPFVGVSGSADDHGKSSPGHQQEQKRESDADRMFEQALHCYESGDVLRGDSLAVMAIQAAETTFRHEDILAALIRYFSMEALGSSTGQRLSYAKRAEELAGMVPNRRLAWEAYVQLSGIYLDSYEFDRALSFAYKSLTEAESVGDQRMKALSYLRVGHALQAANQNIEAFRYYLNALTLAESLEISDLQLEAYVAMSRFYSLSNIHEKAIEYKIRQVDLIAASDPVDSSALMWAKCDLENITIASHNEIHPTLLDEIFDYAERAGDNQLTQYALALYRSFLMNNDRFEELRALYVKRFPHELEFLRQNQPSLYHRILAIFAELDQDIPAALANYAIADSLGALNPNKVMISNFYLRYGEFLERQGMEEEAVLMFQKAYDWASEASYLEFTLRASGALTRLYAGNGDYERAFTYAQAGRMISDSMASVNRRDELLALELQNTARIQEMAMEQAQLERERKYNIQYMAIVIGIATLFVILIMLGSFRVSSSLIYFLGFVSFILLFEFIILLADNYIHHLTHGAPLHILGIKIVLIAFLYPFHHWIEKRVTTYLINRRLVSLDNFTISYVVGKIKGAAREIWARH